MPRPPRPDDLYRLRVATQPRLSPDELTRSGTPYRRVENLRVMVDWFGHFLSDGKRGMPPLPRVRGGR